MNDYREAKCIELHDSNIAISLPEEAHYTMGIMGRMDDFNKPCFFIKPSDVAMLAEMFGVNTSNIVNLSSGIEDIDLLKFSIYKKYADFSADSSWQVIKIECQVISERMVNIKVTFKWNDPDEDFPEDVQEMTYCGSFTIWWKSKNEAIDS